MLKTMTILALALFAATASAQVFRCQDASGKLTFSDRPCGTGQNGVMVQRQRSEVELMMERERAYEAEQRKRERRMVEQEMEWAEQQQRAMQPAPVVRHSGNDWQARKDLENARTSSGSIMNNGGRFDRAAEAQRERDRKEAAHRRAAANPPTHMTHCAGGFCYDDRGTPYSQNGPELIRSSDGRVCRVIGGMTQCN